MREQFTVKNIKCSGCVDTIRAGLNELAKIQRIEVNIEQGTVCVEGDGLDRPILTEKLRTLGYPEAQP